MKTLSFVVLFLAVTTATLAQNGPRVFCADEPEARAFLAQMPETFTAAALSASDNLFESWLAMLSDKTRVPIKDSPVISNKYVESSTAARPLIGWDGSPVQYAAVIVVGGDGQPLAVLILAASDRAVAKARCTTYLGWKFKPTLGQLELRPGIFRSVPVVTFLYTRQTIAANSDKATVAPPPMQVFAKIIN